MKRIKQFITATVILLLSATVSLSAQSSVKVTGVVTSAEDGLPMIGVGVMAGSGNGVITSLDGDYAIEVKPGTELVFSSIGFLRRLFRRLLKRRHYASWSIIFF